ncbi:hypothetical protein C8T65DRAFT_697257 [Cerioporus squamosus]|nr:hypothetical protein C8T65DRAFT_697257 [Cerioporus squamosus]
MFTNVTAPCYIAEPVSHPGRREELPFESESDLLVSVPQRLSAMLPHRLLPHYDTPDGYRQEYDVQTIWTCAHYRVCWDPEDDCRYQIRSEADCLTLRVGPLALVPPKVVLSPRSTWPRELKSSSVSTSAEEAEVVDDVPLLVLSSCEHGTVYIQARSAPWEPPLLKPITLRPEFESGRVGQGTSSLKRKRSTSPPADAPTVGPSVPTSMPLSSSAASSSPASTEPSRRTRQAKNTAFEKFTCNIKNCTTVLTSDELWVAHLQDTHLIPCKEEWKSGSCCPCCPEGSQRRPTYVTWSTFVRHHKGKHRPIGNALRPCPGGGGCSFVLKGIRDDSLQRHLVDRHKMTNAEALQKIHGKDKDKDKENVPPAGPVAGPSRARPAVDEPADGLYRVGEVCGDDEDSSSAPDKGQKDSDYEEDSGSKYDYEEDSGSEYDDYEEDAGSDEEEEPKQKKRKTSHK